MAHIRLNHFHDLPDGRRVRLRLPQARDRDDLHELLAGLGLAARDLDVRRALRWSPGRRVSLVATAWDGATERIAGFGALDCDAERLTLLAGPPVAGLLREALEAEASAWARRVA